MEELVALAEERDRVLMPGHLLLYHPGLRMVKELVDSGALGEVACVYGNRQNLGVIRSNENALWSLGVHDLSVILWLLDEEPVEAVAHGMDYLQKGIEDVVFCFLRFPSGQGRAHAPVVARSAQDAEDDRRRPREDGRVRRHGARAQGDRVREGTVGAGVDVRRVAHADGGHLQPEDPERRAAQARAPALPAPRRGRPRRPPRGPRRARGRSGARPTDRLARAPAHRHDRGGAPHGCRPRGDRARRGRQGPRARRRGQAADAVAPLDREPRASASDRGAATER